MHENSDSGPAALDEHAVLVTLEEGWNTLLARVANTYGAYELYARLSVDPLDLAKAFDRSGEWDTALVHWNRVLENDPEDVISLVRRS